MGPVSGSNITQRQPEINITDVLTLIIHEISLRTETFKHVNIGQTMVCMASNKKTGRGVTYGKLVPLRFKNGMQTLKYREKYYSMPGITANGIPMLYIIYFYFPKFFDLPPAEKLRVIFHELYHISPEFNGDIRRFGKIKISHGFSRKRFDGLFEDEQRNFYNYISQTPFMNFLEANTRTLSESFRRISGARMKVPKPRIIQTAEKEYKN